MTIYVCVDEGVVVAAFDNLKKAENYRKISKNSSNLFFKIKEIKLNQGIVYGV
jgi:hypothetical protein